MCLQPHCAVGWAPTPAGAQPALVPFSPEMKVGIAGLSCEVVCLVFSFTLLVIKLPSSVKSSLNERDK